MGKFLYFRLLNISSMSTRRLAAILFADIAGYTAMMQENEQQALAHLQKFKVKIV